MWHLATGTVVRCRIRISPAWCWTQRAIPIHSLQPVVQPGCPAPLGRGRIGRGLHPGPIPQASSRLARSRHGRDRLEAVFDLGA
jgi:hypothetical protein